METKEQCEAGIKGLHGKPITPSGDALIVKFAEAPNPSKKRTPMFYYPQQWVAGNVEEGSIPTMGIFQPVFSTDAVMSQNGASAIPPTQTPRMFFPCEFLHFIHISLFPGPQAFCKKAVERVRSEKNILNR